MNILFITLVKIGSIAERGIYPDLLRKFVKEGHNVTIVTPIERRYNESTKLYQDNGATILRVKTFNVLKTNIIEKGIGTLAIEYQYLSAIKKYLKNTKFDLVLYSTPPITFVKVIKFVKNRDDAFSYLLLKDIFPQNAVDMKMLKKDGFLHKIFLKKEKKLYEISDAIGCMSRANVDYVLTHNPEIDRNKVEINPNSIEPVEFSYSRDETENIRQKFNLPLDKKIFVYGGNLGRPQGIGFLLETIENCKNENVYFLVVGDGTEFNNTQSWFNLKKPQNATLLRGLKKSDYDTLLGSCDVGLVFLDKNFLIPNFPARTLSYLEMKMPIITATDTNTDVGDIVEKANCGRKVISGDLNFMLSTIDNILKEDLNFLGENSLKLLYDSYLVDRSYNTIINRINKYV